MKIHIVGIAGSGKTTLARWAAATFAVEAFDLDHVVYDRAAGERSAEEIARRIDDIRRLDGWVTEGAYRDAWLTPLLNDATAIVWLDVSLPTAIIRMVKRHLRAELARNNLHPGWIRLAQFLNYNRETASVQRAETIALLAPYSSNVSHLRTTRDVAAFKARIRA